VSGAVDGDHLRSEKDHRLVRYLQPLDQSDLRRQRGSDLGRLLATLPVDREPAFRRRRPQGQPSTAIPAIRVRRETFDMPCSSRGATRSVMRETPSPGGSCSQSQ
jgi:hypothetical protein